MTVAFAAAFTLRHRIPSTTANSFEPYFHPRMLAFGVGALAVAAVLRRRFWLAIALVAVSGLIHVTTGLWFAVMVGVAIATPRSQLPTARVGGAVAAVAFLVIWAGVAGPLRSSFVTMDAPVAGGGGRKGFLFASEWPLWSWVANLGLIVVAWAAYRAEREDGPSAGAHRLGCDGADWHCFSSRSRWCARSWRCPVQLQISRVFWLVDFVTAHLPHRGRARERTGRRLVAAILVAVAVARGVYVMTVEHPERPLVAVHLPASDWEDAMKWIKAQSDRRARARGSRSRVEVRDQRPRVGRARRACWKR